MDGASVRREAERLVLAGRLDRQAAIALWPQALAAAASAEVLDLARAESVDSAGLAMLVALAAHMRHPAIEGTPAGYEDLRTAYRLAPTLSFDAGQ